MKILLIEDNKSISENVQKYLATKDIKVDVFYDGKKGLESFFENDYDLVLLDIMLPGMDGVQICEKIREHSDIPIIMITAKSQIEDKIEGFDCGADDYITKPFDLDELLARIKAVSKRFLKPDKITYKNIEIFPDSKKVLKDKEEINLTIKELNILEFLLDNRGKVVSKTDIIEYVWGGDAMFEGDEKLDVYISNLRKKLDKELIKTVKGYGYEIDV